MKQATRLVLWTYALLFLPHAAWAAVVFDGFGAGDSFEPPRFVTVANDDVVISGVIVAQDSDWAAAFTPNQDYALTSIELALSHAIGVNQIQIALLGDSSGLPGSLIESWSIGNLSASGEIVTLNSLTHALVEESMQYWIEVSAGDGGTDSSLMGWHTSSGVASPMSRQFDEGAWEPRFEASVAYRVNGQEANAVPSPPTVMLLSLPGVLLMLRKGSDRPK